MPNLNQRRFLEARMDSVFAQTLKDWELVVCDSYSEDGSWEYLREFAGDSRIRLFQVPRRGIYAGWNDCLHRARGEYITIAPSDDTAAPEFLEALTAVLADRWDVDLAVCQFDYTDEHGIVRDPSPAKRNDLLYRSWLNVPHRRPREADILTHLCVGIPWMTTTSLMFRASLLNGIGGFRTDCASRADGLWALNASLQSDCVSLPGRMATWRQHGGQGSAHWERAWWRRSWQLVRGLLLERRDRIPEQWRRDPEWLQELLGVQRTRYLRCMGIDRNEVRERPGRFVVNCLRGLVSEPRFTLRRLSRKLAWDDPELKDEYAHLHSLIKRWNVEWQPRPLDKV